MSHHDITFLKTWIFEFSMVWWRIHACPDTRNNYTKDNNNSLAHLKYKWLNYTGDTWLWDFRFWQQFWWRLNSFGILCQLSHLRVKYALGLLDPEGESIPISNYLPVNMVWRITMGSSSSRQITLLLLFGPESEGTVILQNGGIYHLVWHNIPGDMHVQTDTSLMVFVWDIRVPFLSAVG